MSPKLGHPWIPNHSGFGRPRTRRTPDLDPPSNLSSWLPPRRGHNIWADVARPDRERLRLHSLVAQAQFAYQLKPGQQPAAAPPALPVKAASAIFGELARFGFSTFQQVPGGAQMLSTDGKTNVIITAVNW